MKGEGFHQALASSVWGWRMLRDSFYFLIALLSLAIMIGWFSFLSLAVQA